MARDAGTKKAKTKKAPAPKKSEKKKAEKKAEKKKAAEKKAGKKPAAKKAAEKKAATKTKAEKKPKADATPKPPDDSNEIVVFAIRLKRAERDAIHRAAGSGKASQFVRSLALAAAKGDVKALQQIVKATGK